MEKELHKCSSATWKKIIPASSRNQCLINCNSPWQMRIQIRHSHTNICPHPPSKWNKKQKNANTQRFPFFSWLSEGIWEVLTAWRQTRQRHVGDSCLLNVWQCDVRGLARQRSRRQTDREPLFCSSCLVKKKKTTTKIKDLPLLSRNSAKVYRNPDAPREVGDGSWGAVHQLATFNRESGRPLKGWSVCPLGIWQ